jgi:hypothetical protein
MNSTTAICLIYPFRCHFNDHFSYHFYPTIITRRAADDAKPQGDTSFGWCNSLVQLAGAMFARCWCKSDHGLAPVWIRQQSRHRRLASLRHITIRPAFCSIFCSTFFPHFCQPKHRRSDEIPRY